MRTTKRLSLRGQDDPSTHLLTFLRQDPDLEHGSWKHVQQSAIDSDTPPYNVVINQ